MTFEFVRVGAETVVAEFDPNYEISRRGSIVPVGMGCRKIRVCRKDLENILANPAATLPDAYRQALEQWPASPEGLTAADIQPGWDTRSKEFNHE